MKWYIKAAVQKGLSVLPLRIHDYLYLLIQRRFGKLRNIDFTHKSQRYHYLITNGILTKANIFDKKILELGPGRTLTTAIFLWLLGAKSIVVVDIRNKLDHHVIIAEVYCLLKFISLNPEIQKLVMDERLLELEKNKNDGIFLLQNMPIRFSLFDDLSDSEFFDLDLQFSLDVLEHIPQRYLASIFFRFQRKCNRGCIFINFVDHSDHFAHIDASISKINFLRFSPVIWDLVTSPSNYTNRLRHEDYMALFDEPFERITYFLIKDFGVFDDQELCMKLHRDYRYNDLSIIATVYMFRNK